ncbi:MAG: RdgB/HAM1 family non-canonical purine NTP pyrophosphatase [Actinomycetota bacterium]|nr:RdgB/HAM1 family non-canonical purine NTP pyrophosphatase [Actinomycetota bacterium]
MPFPDLIALATRNPGKIREIRTICADWPVRWLTAGGDDRPWPDLEEPGETYAENALAKARTVVEALGVPALADDSGIEVDALGGGPGPRSARFAGEHATEQQNLDKLIEALAGVPPQQRTARYRCVAVLARPGGSEVRAEGVCEGTLITEPRGTGGFGYDPIFLPAGFERTMAELSLEEKDRISHRGKALRALGRILTQETVTGSRR